MAWADTGTLWVMKGGVLNTFALSSFTALDGAATIGELSFAQISDSHMGFNKPAYTDVVSTLKALNSTYSTGVPPPHRRHQPSC